VQSSDVASIRVIVCTAATASLLPCYLHFTTAIVDDASCIREIDLLPALALADSVAFIGQSAASTLRFPNFMQTKLGVHDSLIPRLCRHLSSADSLKPLKSKLTSCFATGRELLGDGTELFRTLQPKFYGHAGKDRQVRCDCHGVYLWVCSPSLSF
jgi:hypothetical protein